MDASVQYLREITDPVQKYSTLNKVVVIGANKTGKTCFLKKIVNDSFSTLYKPSIGVDFSLKKHDKMHDNKHDKISHKMMYWDVSGTELVRNNFMFVYCRDANAIIFVMDINDILLNVDSNDNSFYAVKTWYHDFIKKSKSNSEPNLNTNPNIYCVFNKLDLCFSSDDNNNNKLESMITNTKKYFDANFGDQQNCKMFITFCNSDNQSQYKDFIDNVDFIQTPKMISEIICADLNTNNNSLLLKESGNKIAIPIPE